MKTSKVLISVVFSGLLLFSLTSSCKKDPPKTIPTLSTAAATDITSISASTGGLILSDGNTPITNRGVCWSANENPTISDSKTSDGKGIGGFTSLLSNLLPGTTYFVRAYATNAIGTGYGNQITITTTSVLGAITTAEITEITATTVKSGGNITADGGAAIVVRGVCWSIKKEPTARADSTTKDGAGVGVFTSSVVDLSPGKLYYLRAYATNSIGTSYGNQIEFNTSAIIPTVITSEVTDITPISAIGKGEVISEGGAAVSTRGICWSTNETPTIKDSITVNGTGIGTFSSELIDLLEKTKYYIRAYATNSAGTGYGSVITFTTIERSVNSDYKPLGLEFDPIEVWRTIPTDESYTPQATPLTKSAELKAIINVPTPGSQGNYNNCTAWAVGYGMMSYRFNSIEGYTDYNGENKLFNPFYIWNQVRKYNLFKSKISFKEALDLVVEQGCCKFSDMPNMKNRDLPSAKEKENAAKYKITTYHSCPYNLKQLKYYISVTKIPIMIGVNIDNAFHWNSKNQFDEKIRKEDGRLVWKKYIDTKRDGHAMLICGFDDKINAFKVLNSWGTNWGQDGYCWIDYDFLKIAVETNDGYPCIAVAFIDRSVVKTSPVSETTSFTAKCGGSIIANYGKSIIEKGICWSTNSEPTIDNDKINFGTGMGSFTGTITNLYPGTTYYVKAYARNEHGISYGTPEKFTTSKLHIPTVKTSPVTSFDHVSATVGGVVTADGGATVIENGIFWKKTENPLDEWTKFIISAGEGVFSKIITDLEPNTTYYIKAYAINGQGTAYGEQIEFKTNKLLSLATVFTTSALNITENSATLGGNVREDGNVAVNERGVVYSTSQNPTTASTKVVIGNGTGIFSSTITGLAINTTYYVRAYAINNQGIAYSDQISFRTLVDKGLRVGDSYGGGKVAYILVPGDPGYDANMQHGLIAAITDQSTGIGWLSMSWPYTSTTSTALGTGSSNTTLIIASQSRVSTNDYAAGIARTYTGGGFNDWFLPSKDELYKLYINRVAIGGFVGYGYWSSSKSDRLENTAICYDFRWLDEGYQITWISLSRNRLSVRAARYF